MNIVDQQPPSKGPLNDTIDLKSSDEKATTGPIEDLVDLPVDDRAFQGAETWKELI